MGARLRVVTTASAAVAVVLGSTRAAGEEPALEGAEATSTAEASGADGADSSESGAAQPGAISVRVAECLSSRAEEIRRMLALELGVRVSDSARASGLEVEVECEDGWVVLSVLPNDGQAPDRTRLDVSTVDTRVLARVVALRIAELVEGREPAPAPAPPPARVVEIPPQPPPSAAPPRRVRGPRFAVEWQARAWLERLDLSGGPGLRLAVPLAGGLSVSAGGLAELGRTRVDGGRVRSRSASFDLGLEWARVRGASGFAAMAGVRAGYVGLRGAPDDASVGRGGAVDGPWGGPLLAAQARHLAHGPLSLGIRLELGYAAWTVLGRVNRADSGVWQGPWLGGAVSVLWPRRSVRRRSPAPPPKGTY